MGNEANASGPVSRYLRRLGRSVAWRHEADFPQIGGLVVILVLAVAAYIALSILAVPEDRKMHFASERGSVTALSAIFLGAGAAFAFLSCFVQHRASGRDRGLWLLVAMALAFLALDELLEFHERVGWFLADGSTGLTLPPSFRNWNDVVVIAYGLVAIPFVIYLFPAIWRYPRLAETFAVAFLFYLIHTLIDSTQEPPTTYSIIAEESAKLFSSAFLAFGAFIGTVGIMWNRSR